MAWSSFRSRSSSGFAPYVPVAQRREQAAKAAAKAAKNGAGWSPVVITGKKIATTFWGKAWCDHLESYSDYENRLPRGRTYVRNGSVVDLQIDSGRITACVQGSSLYTESIKIKPLAPARWVAIKAACAGKITSLVGLLQGRLPDEVLRVITDRASGLFPAPAEIELDCSCPDSASLCKHLAAVLYGVGARLDTRPELLFLLRGVDHQELVAEALNAVTRVPLGMAEGAGATLGDEDLSSVFGIDIAAGEAPVVSLAATAPSLPASVSVGAPLKPSKLPKPPLQVVRAKGLKLSKAKPAVTKSSVHPTKKTAKAITKSKRGVKIKRAVNASSAPASAIAEIMASLDTLLATKTGAKAGGVRATAIRRKSR